MQKPVQRGVYFRTSDYPGFFVRLAIVIIDGGVVVGAWWGMWMIATVLPFDREDSFRIFALSNLAFVYLYLIEMKRRLGSLGNLATRTRVVSLSGDIPSIGSMLVRTAMWVMGPIVFLVDLLWVLSDRSRQMIRDRLSGTYVIRGGAVPIGSGRIAFTAWMLLGYSLLFKEVRKEGGEPGATDNPDDAQRLREDH